MVYIKSNPEQTILLPTDLRSIIPKDHICFLKESQSFWDLEEVVYKEFYTLR